MIENLLQQMSKEKLNKLLCQGPERGNFGFSVNLRTNLYFVRQNKTKQKSLIQ